VDCVREAKRHAAFERSTSVVIRGCVVRAKAPSPLHSAGAVQDACAKDGDSASAKRRGLRAAFRRFRALLCWEFHRTCERTRRFASQLGGQDLVEGGIQKDGGAGLGGGEPGFQLVAQRQQLLHLRHNPPLFGRRGKRKGSLGKII